MAATSLCRLSALSRQFQRVVKISPSVQARNYTQCAASSQCCLTRPFCEPLWLTNVGVPSNCRLLHTSTARRGLEEFFDAPENWGETTVKSGAAWTAKQLRTKSNEDLHKLWYVLLKERNMLKTIEQEGIRQRVQMPSPERLKKVDRSMKRLDTVVQERETALRLLQTGQERPRPGDWRKDVFGHVYWYQFKEHPIPWHLNKRYKRKRFFTPGFVNPYIRLRFEKHLRAKVKEQRREKEKQQKLAQLFPKQSALS